MSINVVTLVGRICNEPELRYTGTGTAIGNFRIAVDRMRKVEGQPDADFLDIIAFGKTAEFVNQYLDKGARIGIIGRIQSRNWETKDGQKRTSVEIVADTVQTLETRSEAEARRGDKRGPQGDETAQGEGTVLDGTNARQGAAQADAGAQLPDVEDPFGDQ